MSHEIRCIAERLVYENRFVKVYDDVVQFPDGSPGTYVRLDSAVAGTAVVLIPLNEGRIGLVRTFRYALRKLELGLPRGFSQGVSIEDTARRELREELGVDAIKLNVLGYLTPDSGIQSARVAVVEAPVVGIEGEPEDSVEVESVHWLPESRVEEMIRAGEIEDGFTIAALALLRLQRSA
ncbi:NUDIX hydrolase [Arthrobacter globiformis]|uniref:NUDIX hydrolase n=1 Tax=Arthrobacter globiformis TaxID=1665 RepID=UPI003978B40A